MDGWEKGRVGEMGGGGGGGGTYNVGRTLQLTIYCEVIIN